MKNKTVRYITIALPLVWCALTFSSLAQGQNRDLYAFDFEMEHIPIAERAKMLVDLGYKGVACQVQTPNQIANYKAFMATEEAKAGEFDIPVGLYMYDFSTDQEQWKKVLAFPSLKSLWVVLLNEGEKVDTDKIDSALKAMAVEAQSRGKDLVIYPHDNTLIESVEETIPFIERLNMPNVYLSMHSCHELRAGNGHRMLDVAIKAAPYLKFATIAGSDVTMQDGDELFWGDAIKPLDEGDYDIAQFLDALNKIGYEGEMILHTFGIKQATTDHLSRSLAKWNDLTATAYDKDSNVITEVLDAPESAYWHAPSQSWFVSSLGGGKVTLEQDNYGWITRLDKDGNVVNARWVEGLDAPTGMAADDHHLYVGDRAGLVKIDIAKAAVLETITLPSASFINDVAMSPQGDIYVSDTYGNSIYKVSKSGAVSLWLQSEALEFPNGIWVVEQELILATWGPMTNLTTFETSRKGTLKKIDLKSKKISAIGKGPIANIDGVIQYKDDYYVTDWTGGRLLKISPLGVVTEIVTGFDQLADLGLDAATGMVMMPEMSKNRFIKVNLGALNSTPANP